MFPVDFPLCKTLSLKCSCFWSYRGLAHSSGLINIKSLLSSLSSKTWLSKKKQMFCIKRIFGSLKLYLIRSSGKKVARSARTDGLFGRLSKLTKYLLSPSHFWDVVSQNKKSRPKLNLNSNFSPFFSVTFNSINI